MPRRRSPLVAAPARAWKRKLCGGPVASLARTWEEKPDDPPSCEGGYVAKTEKSARSCARKGVDP